MASVGVPEEARERLRLLLRRYRFAGHIYVSRDGEIHMRLMRSVAQVMATREKLDAFEQELGVIMKEVNAEHSAARVEVVRGLGTSSFAEMMRRRRDGAGT